MHLNQAKYEELVSRTLAGNTIKARVFLEIDGIKSRKEIQNAVGGADKQGKRTELTIGLCECCGKKSAPNLNQK